MGWQDQGRQEHGYFGHGTAPKTLDERLASVTIGALVYTPRRLRSWIEPLLDAKGRERIAGLMKAWIAGDPLDQQSFAHYFFDRRADSPDVLTLRLAAHGAELATTRQEIHEAADRLATAIHNIGYGNWTRFMAQAEERAASPETQAAINLARKQANPRLDAINPSSVPDMVLGGVGAALRKGVTGVASAIAGAMVRELLPEKPTSVPEASQASPIKVPQSQAMIEQGIKDAINSDSEAKQLEGKVARDSKNAGFDVVALNQPLGQKASIGEIDVETEEAIIEVTTRKQGKSEQIYNMINDKRINPQAKPVILFAPNYGKYAGRHIEKLGAYVVRSTEELIAILRSMKAK